ncbi:MAG: DUF58 domain-containing protein [Planctomycetota bacterium]
MLADAREPIPDDPRGLLDPALAAALDRLDVASTRMFAGRLPGERRSKRRGRSVEFDDFRPYASGDDLRFLDWNVFARFDRLVVKLFRDEQDLAVHVVVDLSRSMAAGSPRKDVAASRLGAAIATLALRRQNRVGLSAITPAGVRTHPPARGRRQTEPALAFMHRVLVESAEASLAREAPSMPEAARRIARTHARDQGVVVIISDLLVRDELAGVLDAFAAGGRHDVHALHMLSPDELDPSLASERGLRGDLRLSDAESPAAAEVTITPRLLEAYQRRLARFQQDCERLCRSRGITRTPITSADEPAELIFGTLRNRGLLKA